MKLKSKSQLVKETPPETIGRSRLPRRVEKILVPGILDSCQRKEVSPAIALLKLMSVCRNSADLEAVVELAIEATAGRNKAALSEISDLYKENRAACERAMTMSQEKPVNESMSVNARIARVRESFDAWVEEDAAMSVAAYTFGNPRLMLKATQEIIDVLEMWGLLGPAVDALQIGCGTGRVEALLAPKVRLAWGIDISAKMISTARRNVAGLENVRLSKCSGLNLAPFDANTFDLVYAVDSFPYIVRAGAKVVDDHFAEVARVLRAKGHFVIFHYSYRGELRRDRTDVRRQAAAHGYAVVREAVTPFTIWDGVGYQLQKTSG